MGLAWNDAKLFLEKPGSNFPREAQRSVTLKPIKKQVACVRETVDMSGYGLSDLAWHFIFTFCSPPAEYCCKNFRGVQTFSQKLRDRKTLAHKDSS